MVAPNGSAAGCQDGPYMKATTSILSRGQHPGGALGFEMAQCGVPVVITSAHVLRISEAANLPLLPGWESACRKINSSESSWPLR
jgi:hypothetical protein